MIICILFAALRSTSAVVPSTRYDLLDGNSMPVIGLGVYAMNPGKETQNAVAWALEAGYRMIDTAAMYRNEADVGLAVKNSGIPREEIFIASKLQPQDHGYEKTKKAFKKSLKKLDMAYMDLYIIHAPQGGKLIETWDAMLEMQRKGLVRSVAVSNFGVNHLKALVDHKRPLPVLNQFEMHPLQYNNFQRQKILKFCEEHKILVQAYGSLFWGNEKLIDNKAFTEIAEAHKKTNSQVLLRWALQKGFQIIPKSKNQQRIIDNANIFDFELTEEQLEKMSSIQEIDIKSYWNPIASPVKLGDTEKYKPKEKKQQAEL